MPATRRDFLKGAAGLVGASLVGAAGPAVADTLARSSPGKLGTPVPGRLGIDHVVVVMMENRSFDHFLGWVPGANGIGVSPDGRVTDPGRYDDFSYSDASGQRHAIYHTDVLNACGQRDQDHGYVGGRVQWNGGRMDGFLADTNNTTYALSYYLAAQRPFMSQLVLNYTTCDNYFCSYLGPTWPNRFFQHSAQTDRLEDSTAPDGSALEVSPTAISAIWDQLNGLDGPSGRYYFSDLPFVAFWGQKYLPISAQYPQFLADCAAGTLPNVAIVDPRFEDEGSGTSGDDHPLSDLRAGDAFLSEVFHAVASGPAWARTVLVINYDEWGGFFDHVPPPLLAPGNQYIDTKDVVRGPGGIIEKVLGGFRVPCVIASPFTKGDPDRPRVVSTMFDHASVLALIEANWGLRPLTPRDASIPSDRSSPESLSNLGYALDLHHPRLPVPDLPELAPFVSTGCDVPGEPQGGPTVGGQPLPSAGVAERNWQSLKDSGLLAGWI
jgi:phospholipase C